jgi:Zn-finger nucleic acid-binding protein
MIQGSLFAGMVALILTRAAPSGNPAILLAPMSSGPYRAQPPSARSRPGRTRCPGCSTEVDDTIRRCPSCGTPVATVRCARCFAMNPPEAALCLGCGHQLGLEPLGEPDALRCPDCKTAFQLFRGGPGTLHDCGSCGAQFVEHALLADLLEQRELYGRSAPRPPPRHNPLESPMRYVACPVCRDMMTRRNFGRSSGVIVDVCVSHGVFFDRGELPRVLDFVEAGGLAPARQREGEAATQSRGRERLQRIEKLQEAMHAPVGLRGFQSTLRCYEAGEASLELLGVLADLIGDR